MISGTTSLLAAYLSPGLFFGGAAAVAAPILIHLLARRRFRRIRWAAMDFLLDAQRRNRRRIRMEEWVLLALRCLAILLIALFMSRPFIMPGESGSLFGGTRRSERVFVLDDSFSMGYSTPDGTMFDRAKLATRRLLESIGEETPDDTVTIIRASQPTSPVESGVYLEDNQRRAVYTRLAALSPTQRTIDPRVVMEGVAEVLERSPDVTGAVVYVISDFQRTNWTTVASGGDTGTTSEAGPMSPLTEWAGNAGGQTGGRSFRLVLIQVGEENASNLAVTGLELHGPRLIAGTTGSVRGEISNFGQGQMERVDLDLVVGHRPQESRSLPQLSPWQTASVDLDAEFLRSGFESVTLELPPDPTAPGLPADNIRYLAVEVAQAIRILVVDGEPSTDEFDDEVTFLATALRPEGALFSGNEVTVIDESKFDDTPLARFHLVILANVYRLSEPAVESLERFVRGGGGLLVFLGDQVDADLYNTALYRDGEGLLPAELTEILRTSEAAHLSISDLLHPAMRGLGSDGDPLGLGQIPFFSYFGCILPEVIEGDDASEGLNDGSKDLDLASVRPARVLARFDDPLQSAALVERRFGAGRVILFTTTADKEWHFWPDHPTFLPVMMELARHAARRGSADRSYSIGQTIELPLDPASFELDVLVRTPAYPDEQEVNVTAVSTGDGRGLSVLWEHTDDAGLYQFLFQRRTSSAVRDVVAGEPGAAPALRMVSVNIDPAESDLTPSGEDQLRRVIGDVPFTYINGLDELSDDGGESRNELWRIFLVLALIVLLAEQGLAWAWGRRR